MEAKQRRLGDLSAGVSPAALDTPCSDDQLMELADDESDGADTDEEADAERMPEAQREILGEYTDYLSERMVPERVVEGLQKLGVFDRHDKETVLAKQTTKERNEEVIELVMRRGTHAFPKFVRALQRIHSSLAKKLQSKLYPVKCRVLWLAESASHAAIVVHTLEKPEYAGVRFDDIVRAPGCLFRCGVVSGHETRCGMEQVEIIVVFPVHESLLSEAMESAFNAVCPQADIAVMCGVCKGRGESVKSGDTIMVTQAVENSLAVPWNSIGPKMEFIQVLSSHLQQLFTTTPLWLADVNSANQKEASMQYQSLWLTRLFIELQKVQDSRWLHSLGWDMSRPSLLNEHNQATVDRNCCDWKNGYLVASLLKQRSWCIDQSSPLGVAPNPALLTQVQEQLTFDTDYPPQPPNYPLGMPHFGAIETLTDKTELARTHIILASDANSFMFYNFCNSKLGPGKPWFVCKGVPREGSETGSVMASTCLLVEVIEIFAIEMDTTTT